MNVSKGYDAAYRACIELSSVHTHVSKQIKAVQRSTWVCIDWMWLEAKC